MSDQSSFFTPTIGQDAYAKLRDRVEAGLGKSRLKTTQNFSSFPQTLAGASDEVRCDMTSGAGTVNLPTSPADGDHYEFTKIDSGGNALTIGRNGKTINGVAADVTISTQWASKRLTWNATADTWWSR